MAGRSRRGRSTPPDVERLLTDPVILATAARQLLELHFTPTLASLICDAVDLDVATLEASALGVRSETAANATRLPVEIVITRRSPALPPLD